MKEATFEKAHAGGAKAGHSIEPPRRVALRSVRSGDPAPTNQPLIFLHLQKTGGSAVKHYLEETIPAEQIITTLSHESEARATLARHAEMAETERNGVQVIFGHSAKVFRQIYPYSPVAAFVRDPFDRAMSQYIYERRNAYVFNLRESDRPLPHEVSFKRFMHGFLAWGTRREDPPFALQARTMADFLGLDFNQLSADDARNMARSFDFLGTQNQFALSAFLLSLRYDFPLRPIPLVNAYADLTRQFFPKSFVQEVYAASALDFALFETATQRLEGEALQHLSEKTEWKRWNSYLRQTEREIRTHLLGSNSQYVESTVPREQAVAIADGVNANITAITLPVGNWDVSGLVGFTGERDTLVSYLLASISPMSAKVDGAPGARLDTFLSADKSTPVFVKGNTPSLAFPPRRVDLAEPTKLYLVALAEFGAGKARAFGTISARKA